MTKPIFAPPGKTLRSDGRPVRISLPQAAPSTVAVNGIETDGACIECPEMPCMRFSEDELKTPQLPDFPYLRKPEVCPVDAISQDPVAFIPKIDPSACIGCGLCISRCPPKAIFLDKANKATVNIAPNGLFLQRPQFDAADHQRVLAELAGATVEGLLLPPSQDALFRVLKPLVARQPQQRLLVRNLLLALGAKAALCSTGDTNVRIETWFVDGETLWLGEIDFNSQSLVNSPRSLLDDYAVVVGRHRLPRENISLVVICNEFPNKRGDYYHIVEDVENVLGFPIHTISVAALLLLLWYRVPISRADLREHFRPSVDDETIAADMRMAIPNIQNGILLSRYFQAMK